VIGRLDMSFIKLSLRMKLIEFIGPKESIIIEKINDMYKDLSSPFVLKLWYEKNEIEAKELRRFLKKWESKLRYKTLVKANSSVGPNEFTWFDIIPFYYKGTGHYRFQYVYKENNFDAFLESLNVFHRVTKFCTSPKPQKRKQKRNDYED
jgi:hypothetical protein